MADELSNLWASFSLAENEGDEVEIQAIEVEGAVKRGQSCVIGKLLSERTVSKETIKATLIRWWRLKGTFTFKILGENLFIIEFELAKDKIKVLEGRPWVFESNLFLIEDFDGRTAPSEYAFDKASFWVRMMNLPLACMGREVGFKLGTAIGTVEEVDTDKDGIGWGEFLRVKILIDLYKPLSRGRMLKFDGKSQLIGFKYERMPKFCFHCGVVCHGIEGCLKRSTKRNQENLQFGPWMRAGSPTQRPEKYFEKYAGHSDVPRYAQPAPEEWKPDDEHLDRGGYNGRKRRQKAAGGEEHGGGVFRGRRPSKTPHGKGENHGRSYEENFENIPTESQHDENGGVVGIMKDRFEKQSINLNEERNQVKHGKNHEGVKEAGSSEISKGKDRNSPAGDVLTGQGVERESSSQQALIFSSPGGPYSGPMLADVEKSMRGAQIGNMAAKRKYREEETHQLEGTVYRRKKTGREGDDLVAARGRGETDYGSGMAAAENQPRRPQ